MACMVLNRKEVNKYILHMGQNYRLWKKCHRGGRCFLKLTLNHVAQESVFSSPIVSLSVFHFYSLVSIFPPLVSFAPFYSCFLVQILL